MFENVYIENLTLLKKHLPEIEKSLKKKMKSSFEKRDEGFFKLSNSKDVLCIYKIFLHENLLKWLDENQNRKIIFLENDLSRIDYFLHEKKTKDFLGHNRIEFFLLEEDTIKKICWDNIFRDITLVTCPSYQKDPCFLKLKEEKNYLQIGIEATFSWYSDLAVSDLFNFYCNLQKKDKIYSFSSLKDKAKNIPAIICGAGPSLETDEKNLKKFKDKALIFAGGTAMNILNEKNIFYHFGASLEKGNQNLRFKMLKNFERPIFYRPIISPDNLRLSFGPLFYVSDHETLPFQKWIEEKLNIKSENIEGGWTVTTFLISLAQFMGCNPIVLAGVDLCFSKEKYACSMFKEESFEKYNLLETKNIFGEKVITQRDFLIAAFWIEEFVKNNPQTNFINCSKGLAIKSIENKNWDQMDLVFLKQMDILNFSHYLTSQSNVIDLSSKDIKKVLNEIIMNLQEAGQLISQILLQWEKEKNFQENFFEMLLNEKAVYRFLLHPVWLVWKPFLKQKISGEIPFSFLEIEKINKMVFMQKVIFSHLDIARKAYEKI